MSPLSFVHSDGSSKVETQNKRLVRSHVSKYFHPKKQGQKPSKQQPLKNCRPRLLAPSLVLTATSGHENQGTELELVNEAVLDVSKCGSSGSRNITPPFLEETLPFSPPATNFDVPCIGSIEYIEYHNDNHSTYHNPADYQYIEQAELEIFISDSGTHGVNNGEDNTNVLHNTYPSNFWSWDTNGKQRAPHGLHRYVPKMEYPHAITPPALQNFVLLRSLDNPVETSVSQDSRQLVERYASKVDEGARIRGLIPSNLPLRNAYMPAARNHDALWLASVTHSSTMDRIFQRAPIDYDTLKRKGKCIQAINICLEDPSTRIMDETIAAVQAMATVELVCGNIQAFVVHLTAIHEMVRLRGGLQELGFGGLLSCIIQMHAWRWELVAQNCQDIVPCFTRPQPQPVIPNDLHLFTILPSDSKLTPPTRAISSLLLDLQALAIAWDTCAISHEYLLSLSSPPVFSEQHQRIYGRCSTSSREKALKEEWTEQDYEVEAFRLASLLFSSNGIETEDFRLKMRQRRVHQLYESLLRTDLATYWADIPGALIWCFAVGASESWGLELYSWFMGNLVPMLMMLAMERWNELERTLNVFGWLFRCRRAGRVLSRY